MSVAPQSSNIVLIGFMGSGKSSVGRMLSRRLRFQFTDTDTLIEERARMPITELFATQGEERFRERETAVLESLGTLRRHVIATGGGIVTQPRNLPILHKLGWVVFLTADVEELFKRVARNKDRPLLQVPEPLEKVKEMLAERQPIYEETANFRVDSTTLRREEVVEHILAEARKVFGWNAAM